MDRLFVVCVDQVAILPHDGIPLFGIGEGGVEAIRVGSQRDLDGSPHLFGQVLQDHGYLVQGIFGFVEGPYLPQIALLVDRDVSCDDESFSVG